MTLSADILKVKLTSMFCSSKSALLFSSMPSPISLIGGRRLSPTSVVARVSNVIVRVDIWEDYRT